MTVKLDTVVDHVDTYTPDALGRVTELAQTGSAVQPKSVTFAYNGLGQFTRFRVTPPPRKILPWPTAPIRTTARAG